MRWQHPRLGMINPGDFIKLAESTGLITPLTYWVLEAALRQTYAWHEQGLHQPLSVNLSARDLRDPKLLERIGGSLATWGAQPGWIEFELTESALMADPVGALETLTRLKRLDVALTIDDYGTGYSSLSYLQRLPVDSIKIDQSFVTDMVTNKDSAAIVRSTIELAHILDLTVIAEGVEDQGTFERWPHWAATWHRAIASAVRSLQINSAHGRRSRRDTDRTQRSTSETPTKRRWPCGAAVKVTAIDTPQSPDASNELRQDMVGRSMAAGAVAHRSRQPAAARPPRARQPAQSEEDEPQPPKKTRQKTSIRRKRKTKNRHVHIG